MNGETGRWRLPPSAQPGGRPPAPGELALVQSFINTHYDLEVNHGAEVFGTPRALRGWLLARGLIEAHVRVGRRELEQALDVREGLRTLARVGAGRAATDEALQRLNEAASGAAVEVRFAGHGPEFVLNGGGGVAAALGLLLAITARAMIEGGWSRLKVCPGYHCDWAFYDNSRNQTGRWCSMSVCGGRAKARAHYRRRRESAERA